MSRYTNIQPIGFLDNAMYKPPAELMAQVIKTKDAHADEFFGSLKEIQDEVQVDPHAHDLEAAREQESKVMGIIDETTQMGMGDVANLYKYQSNLKKAQRKISDIINKEITPINEHNKRIKEEKKARFAEYDKHPERFDQFDSKEELGAWIDSQYPGYKNEEGGLNKTPEVSLRGKDDNLTIMKNLLQGHVGMDISKGFDGINSGYRKAWKGLKSGDLNQVISNHLDTDEGIKAYLNQKVELKRFKGLTTDVQNEKQILHDEIYRAGQNQFEERQVNDHIIIKDPNRDSKSPSNNDKPVINASSAISRTVGNPYYKKDFDSQAQSPSEAVEDLRGEILENNKNLVAGTEQLFSKVKDDIIKNTGFSDIRVSEDGFNIIGVDENGNEIGSLSPEEVFDNYSATDKKNKLAQFRQNAEDFEAYNLLAQSINEDNYESVRTTEKYNVNVGFAQNPLGDEYDKLIKSMADVINTSYKGVGVAGAMVSVQEIENTPLGAKGDTRMIFVDFDENQDREEQEKSISAKYRAQLGEDTNIIFVEGLKDKIKDGFLEMSHIQQYLTRVDKLKDFERTTYPNGQIQDMFSGNDDMIDFFTQTTQSTSLTSELPTIKGRGDIQFNQDLTQGLGPVVAQQSVDIGTNSGEGYNIKIVMDVKDNISKEHLTTFMQAEKMYQSLGTLLSGLPGRNIINSEGDTNLRDIAAEEIPKLGTLEVKDKTFYRNGKRVENEHEARLMISGYIKLMSER